MDDKAIIEYYRHLDRSFFIENENKRWAGLDEALSIGYGQTISQPSLVLVMTCQLALKKTDRVLEIGTGSGYQTALLAQFAGEVFTVERIAELADKAMARLMQLGFTNIRSMVGDGSLGWPENSPYDKIDLFGPKRALRFDEGHRGRRRLTRGGSGWRRRRCGFRLRRRLR